MRIREPNDQQNPLELYLAYTYLPASQYAEILLTLDRLYRAIAPIAWDAGDVIDSILSDRPIWKYGHGEPALCIESTETGQSIVIRFAPKGRSGSLSWKAGDVDLVLPRWTAPICVVGTMLTAGGWSYERYLDAQLKKAQIENTQAQTESARTQNRLTEAQIEYTRAQTADLLKKHERPRRISRQQPERAQQLEIKAQIQNFYYLVNQSNIVAAEVNGVEIRQLPDDQE